MRFLVDSAAKMKIVKKGLLPRFCFKRAQRRCHFIKASEGTLPGGRDDVELYLICHAKDPITHETFDLVIPTVFYEAAIPGDAIISYGWLGKSEILLEA